MQSFAYQVKSELPPRAGAMGSVTSISFSLSRM